MPQRCRAKALSPTRRVRFNRWTLEPRYRRDRATPELAVVAGPRRLFVVFHPSPKQVYDPVSCRRHRHLLLFHCVNLLLIRANRRNAPCPVRDFGTLARTVYCYLCRRPSVATQTVFSYPRAFAPVRCTRCTPSSLFAFCKLFARDVVFRRADTVKTTPSCLSFVPRQRTPPRVQVRDRL